MLLSRPFLNGQARLNGRFWKIARLSLFFLLWFCPFFMILSIFYINSPIYVVCYNKPHKSQFRRWTRRYKCTVNTPRKKWKRKYFKRLFFSSKNLLLPVFLPFLAEGAHFLPFFSSSKNEPAWIILNPAVPLGKWAELPGFQSIGPLADAYYDLTCPYVCLCVCLRVCHIPFNGLFPPLPEVQCQTFLDFQNPWGKVMERRGLRFEKFSL